MPDALASFLSKHLGSIVSVLASLLIGLATVAYTVGGMGSTFTAAQASMTQRISELSTKVEDHLKSDADTLLATQARDLAAKVEKQEQTLANYTQTRTIVDQHTKQFEDMKLEMHDLKSDVKHLGDGVSSLNTQVGVIGADLKSAIELLKESRARQEKNSAK